MGCHSSIPTIPVLPSNSHYGSGQPCPSASTWWIHIPHQYWHYVDHDTINLPHWRTFKLSALLIKGWGREKGTQKWGQMKVKRELVNQVSYKKKLPPNRQLIKRREHAITACMNAGSVQAKMPIATVSWSWFPCCQQLINFKSLFFKKYPQCLSCTSPERPSRLIITSPGESPNRFLEIEEKKKN